MNGVVSSPTGPTSDYISHDTQSKEISECYKEIIQIASDFKIQETVLKKQADITGVLESDKYEIMYDYVRDSLHAIAENENPATALTIIERINIPEFKEKINKDLFDIIYEVVDEIRTKVESDLVFSQYFLLNTYISNINNEIRSFSSVGGNVSNNILSGDFYHFF